MKTNLKPEYYPNIVHSSIMEGDSNLSYFCLPYFSPDSPLQILSRFFYNRMVDNKIDLSPPKKDKQVPRRLS